MNAATKRKLEAALTYAESIRDNASEIADSIMYAFDAEDAEELDDLLQSAEDGLEAVRNDLPELEKRIQGMRL